MTEKILLLLMAAPATMGSAPLEHGTYLAEVIGKSVILHSAPGSNACILGTGDDDLLKALRGLGTVERSARVELTFERLPMPAFAGPGEGQIPPDRMASVRGQLVAPWCDSHDLFWIVAARPAGRSER